MATIKDVAKMAGVAVSTASYALNGQNKVKPETKKKIEDAAKKLNYQKNGIASDLKKSQTKTIALILSDISGPFFSEIIKGVQQVTLENGYDLIACSSLEGEDRIAVKFLKEKRVDGVVVFAHTINDDTVLESAREGFPIVVLDRYIEHDAVINISVDNVQGGFLATEHLIQLGHKDIAFISGPMDSDDNLERHKGFKQALQRFRLQEHSKWNIFGNFTQEGGYKAIKMLIMQGDLPTAIFFANDEMAIGGLKAFKEKGIRIPEDISVIGFDDILLSQYMTPPLTTIRQPEYDVGALAAHLIFRVLNGEDTNHCYKFATELVVRETTGPARVKI
ncbi:MAG TPA: LacI family DNA-binding transcriptional regulator [Bacillales bacterium]|nr:LacI family DNA-binding transcriptional regulator [Bacillales bacterium]